MKTKHQGNKSLKEHRKGNNYLCELPRCLINKHCSSRCCSHFVLLFNRVHLCGLIEIISGSKSLLLFHLLCLCSQCTAEMLNIYHKTTELEEGPGKKWRWNGNTREETYHKIKTYDHGKIKKGDKRDRKPQWKEI